MVLFIHLRKGILSVKVLRVEVMNRSTFLVVQQIRVCYSGILAGIWTVLA